MDESINSSWIEGCSSEKLGGTKASSCQNPVVTLHRFLVLHRILHTLNYDRSIISVISRAFYSRINPRACMPPVEEADRPLTQAFHIPSGSTLASLRSSSARSCISMNSSAVETKTQGLSYPRYLDCFYALQASHTQVVNLHWKYLCWDDSFSVLSHILQRDP